MIVSAHHTCLHNLNEQPMFGKVFVTDCDLQEKIITDELLREHSFIRTANPNNGDRLQTSPGILNVLLFDQHKQNVDLPAPASMQMQTHAHAIVIDTAAKKSRPLHLVCAYARQGSCALVSVLLRSSECKSHLDCNCRAYLATNEV